MTRTIMIIGAAQEHCLGIQTAQRLGLKVFATDGNKDSVGFGISDSFEVASTYDEIATLAAARKHIANGGRIDGVMTLASDVPYTVAFVAHSLGLPGISLDSARNASEKVLMKERFRERAIPMPLFQEVNNYEQLDDFAERVGLPVVVKPVDSRGARGVQLIRETERLSSAYAEARKCSPTKRVMVEQYLPGPQLSTEGIVLDGVAWIPAIFDRNYEHLDRFAPFIVENGGEMPSRYSDQYWDKVHEVMRDAALALGIKTGFIKGDLVIHEGQVKVIELAARMSGGFFGTVATPASCGVSLMGANIRLALGDKIDAGEMIHKWERGAAIRFSFPPEGIVRSFRGWDKVPQNAACRYAHIFVKPGDRIPPMTNHPSRPAVVVTEGETREQAVISAVELMNQLQWDIENV